MNPYTKPMKYYHELAVSAGYKDFYHAASACLGIRLRLAKSSINAEDVDYVVNQCHLYIREVKQGQDQLPGTRHWPDRVG